MPICTANSCAHKGKEQPDSQFINADSGRTYRQCQACRLVQERYRSSKRQGLVTIPGRGSILQRVKKANIIEPGDPPQYFFEWEEKRHLEYLRNLINEKVIRG